MGEVNTPKLRVEIESLIKIFDGIDQGQQVEMTQSLVDELVSAGVSEVAFSSSFCNRFEQTLTYLRNKKISPVVYVEDDDSQISQTLQLADQKITFIDSFDCYGYSLEKLKQSQSYLKDCAKQCIENKKTAEICVLPQKEVLSLCNNIGLESILVDCSLVKDEQIQEFYIEAMQLNVQLSIMGKFTLKQLRSLIDKVSPKSCIRVESFCMGSSLLPQVILRGAQRASRDFVSEVSLP